MGDGLHRTPHPNRWGFSPSAGVRPALRCSPWQSPGHMHFPAKELCKPPVVAEEVQLRLGCGFHSTAPEGTLGTAWQVQGSFSIQVQGGPKPPGCQDRVGTLPTPPLRVPKTAGKTSGTFSRMSKKCPFPHAVSHIAQFLMFGLFLHEKKNVQGILLLFYFQRKTSYFPKISAGIQHFDGPKIPKDFLALKVSSWEGKALTTPSVLGGGEVQTHPPRRASHISVGRVFHGKACLAWDDLTQYK